MENQDITLALGARLSEARVLAVGDVMLDRFAIGEVERISPEAPIPVFRLRRRESTPGGVGNVVANLMSLGARCELVAAVGDDEAGAFLRERLGALGAGTEGLVIDPDRPTTCKERFLAAGQQLLRVDMEVSEPLGEASGRRMAALAAKRCREVDVVILSDYAKGVVTPDLAQAVIAAATQAGRRVLVDPKGKDYERYRGASLVTPNARELSEAAGTSAREDDEVVAACRALIERFDLGGVLATRSERGMTLVLRDAPEVHLRAKSREVYDVTGAGDTVIATLAAALASGVEPVRAAALANIAAGVVVQKRGTASVTPVEIVRRMNEEAGAEPQSKVASIDDIVAKLEVCRAMNMRIGFTNGCFDLLHPGHLAVLRAARQACDHLVVGINSDASVRRLKGPGRPVQDEASRATMLASLGVVDTVVVFDEPTPDALIRRIRPDVLVKGADYAREDVIGGDFVESYGGRVVLADLKDGFSTTLLVARMTAGADGAADRR